MALTKRGRFWYSESQEDIRAELARYSTLSYPVDHCADAICECGKKIFRLYIDDTEGAAVRICVDCKEEHAIGDSDEYLEGAELEECECPCGSGQFEITAGVALYEGSEDVRWFYLGCRCPKCGLTAAYGDWKNEFSDYKLLLERI